VIVDSYSAAQYIGYYNRATEAQILEGAKTAKEERLRLRGILKRKRVEFERETSPSGKIDDGRGKLIDLISSEEAESEERNEKGNNMDTFV
jgi:hypothetical protein